MVTTSVNTQFHVSKELVDYVSGFEISVDVYYDPATLNTSSYYNFLNGRGNNIGFHSGMMMPGLLDAGSFHGFWRNSTGSSVISKSGLTADWYRFSMIVTSTTVQIKLLNLRTNILLEGNIASVGTIDTADNIDFTFLCHGINGVTGAYGSVGVNVSNIKILRGSTCLLNVPLSEGAGDKVTDVCNSSQYQLSFFTAASGWAKLADCSHWNFRYGFTLYQKAGSSDLYIPNTTAQAEIVLPAPPTGYTRIANYKECRQTFNQCESLFVLDKVDVQKIVVSGALTPSGYNGIYVQNGTWAGNPKYDKIDDPTKNIWKSGTPYDVYGWAIGDFSSQGYWFEHINGDGDDSTPFPWDVMVFSPFVFAGARGDVTVTLQPSSPLFIADIDRIFFNEDGVAKEIEIQDIYSDVVDLTLDRGHLYINSDSDKNFMLYKTDKGVDTPADLKIWAYVEN